VCEDRTTHLDVQFEPTLSAWEVTLAVEDLEVAIRKKYLGIQHIDLEAESISSQTLTDTETAKGARIRHYKSGTTCWHVANHRIC
jgi:hypothetical protein